MEAIKLDEDVATAVTMTSSDSHRPPNVMVVISLPAATIVEPTAVTVQMFDYEADKEPNLDVTVDVRVTRDKTIMAAEDWVTEAFAPVLARLSVAREIGDIHRDNFRDEIERRILHGRVSCSTDRRA